MLILYVTFTIKGCHRSEALKAFKTVCEETRKEDGCICYKLGADLDQENVYNLYEEWESATALDAHTKTAHLAEFLISINAFSAAPIVLKKFEVTRVN
jgi:quinol monooxygenase YgiN